MNAKQRLLDKHGITSVDELAQKLKEKYSDEMVWAPGGYESNWQGYLNRRPVEPGTEEQEQQAQEQRMYNLNMLRNIEGNIASTRLNDQVHILSPSENEFPFGVPQKDRYRNNWPREGDPCAAKTQENAVLFYRTLMEECMINDVSARNYSVDLMRKGDMIREKFPQFVENYLELIATPYEEDTLQTYVEQAPDRFATASQQSLYGRVREYLFGD